MSTFVEPPIALTSQEKKVLGFIAVMVLLGLVTLEIKKLSVPEPKTEKAVPVSPTVVDKTP
jgi:hypothetical protein